MRPRRNRRRIEGREKGAPLVEIRRARIEDADGLRLLLNSLAGEAEPWIREVVIQLGEEREWIEGLIKDDRVHSKNGGKFLFFAFTEDKLVGHVNGMSWAHAPKAIYDKLLQKHGLVGERPGHVGIAVHKDYRGQGIGTKLMERALQELQVMEVNVVTAVANVDNKPSLSFLGKMGFAVYGREGDQVLLKRRVQCGE